MGMGNQHTPETKDMAMQERNQPCEEANRPGAVPNSLMVDNRGTSTPSHFMSGVESIGLGKGNAMGVPQARASL